MLIDRVKIFVKGGKGGSGACSFLRGKYMPIGRPDGGHGGRGGDVIIVGRSSINTLLFFKYKKKFIAEDGHGGSKRLRKGGDGRSITLEVPLGTEIFDETETIKICDISKNGQEFVVAKGGRGGAGNTAFQSSTNRTPKNTVPPKEGEEANIVLSMKILSDAGLIGMPNAGKSSFLNIATNAKSKIADYAFTTLDPVLGFAEVDRFDGLVIADIPGLVEESSKGKGLGHKFLKHIERCPVLIHIISAESEDVAEDYKKIRAELEEYNKELLKKREFVVLNKIDLLSQKEINSMVKKLEKTSGDKVYAISALEDVGIKTLLQDIFEHHNNNIINFGNSSTEEGFL